jgi:hypothetical protein
MRLDLYAILYTTGATGPSRISVWERRNNNIIKHLAVDYNLAGMQTFGGSASQSRNFHGLAARIPIWYN